MYFAKMVYISIGWVYYMSIQNKWIIYKIISYLHSHEKIQIARSYTKDESKCLHKETAEKEHKSILRKKIFSAFSWFNVMQDI